MKKLIAIILMLSMLAYMFAGCNSEEKDVEKTEIIVFAAASLTETLTQLGDAYMKAHPEVKIIFNFDSSGTLKTQIQEGAQCDIFISAGQKQMNELDTSGMILKDSRFDILENKVALTVPNGNPSAIGSYADMDAALRNGKIMLAIGNADVPVGQYTQKIFAYFGLSEEALAAKGCITYGSNVKEVTTQVSEAIVDCGIIYQTDAYSAGLQVVDTATAEMCGQVIYPAAILNASDYAQAFLEFLTSAEADAVFSAVGFTPIG